MVPNLSGYYRFVSQENMDNYLRALGNSSLVLPSYSFLSPKMSARGTWEWEEGAWATNPSVIPSETITFGGRGRGGIPGAGAPCPKSGGAWAAHTFSLHFMLQISTWSCARWSAC